MDRNSVRELEEGISRRIARTREIVKSTDPARLRDARHLSTLDLIAALLPLIAVVYMMKMWNL